VGSSDSICDTTLFCDVLHLFSVNVPDLRMACKNLKPSFTMGSDQIPSFLVKDCLNCFEDVLCFIMNLIVETGVYPDLWRCSKICPVFKSGNKSIVSNYRPIAIIPNFAKLNVLLLHICIVSWPSLYLHISMVLLRVVPQLKSSSKNSQF
jgi:hypothetical protein